ncbi:MAG: hypothetical protein KDD94_00675 [Calditrichaeota bacterium]|nr:hypothetical protein [Calditrichota bacterium]
MNSYRSYFIYYLTLIVLLISLNSCENDTQEKEYQEPIEDQPFYLFTPRLINTSANDTVLFEFRIGEAGEYVLETYSTNYILNDDGIAGDKKANDLVYSCKVYTKEILDSVISSDLYKPLIGHVMTPYGSKNIQAEVWDDQIPLETPVMISETIQKMSHIVNIVGKNQSISSDYFYIKEFYKHFSDSYQFINIIFDGITSQMTMGNPVQNHILGIGLSDFSDSAQLGSSHLEYVVRYPNSHYFDGASKNYVRNLGLRWTETIEAWPLSDLIKGITGYPYYPAAQLELVADGDESWKMVLSDEPAQFTDVELYFMGLISTDDVSNHFIFSNTLEKKEINDAINDPADTLKIDDILTTYGPRYPGYLDSEKIFGVATIIVSRNLLSAKELSFYNQLSKRSELEESTLSRIGIGTLQSNPFFVATGGRAKIDAKIY